MAGKGTPVMKDRKNLLLVSLLLAGSLLACGLGMAGRTWAWPTVSEKSRQQLTIGTVDCSISVRQGDQGVPLDTPLEPGSYSVEITSTGDASGWFWMWIFAAEGDTDSVCYRTGLLQPSERISFELRLAEPAWVTVEPRWDELRDNMGILNEGQEVYWGIPEVEASDEATEPETESTGPETESTEPETESTEPETEATEPETEATEPETESTEPGTEATEPQTETTENE